MPRTCWGPLALQRSVCCHTLLFHCGARSTAPEHISVVASAVTPAPGNIHIRSARANRVSLHHLSQPCRSTHGARYHSSTSWPCVGPCVGPTVPPATSPAPMSAGCTNRHPRGACAWRVPALAASPCTLSQPCAIANAASTPTQPRPSPPPALQHRHTNTSHLATSVHRRGCSRSQSERFGNYL